MRTWYFVLPKRHPMHRYAVAIEGDDVFKAFDQAKDAGIPPFSGNAGPLYYSDKMRVDDKEVITLDDYTEATKGIEQ